MESPPPQAPAEAPAHHLAALIRARGPVGFDTFMETALYHTPGGYYTDGPGAAGPGRGGDFFTSVSVGPCFGSLLARQVAEVWDALGRPAPVTLVEAGANTGQLSADIVAALPDVRPDLAPHVVPVLAERSATLRDRITNRQIPNARTVPDVSTLAPRSVVGIVVANELVDALPVRLVRFEDRRWHERKVDLRRHGDTPAFRFVDTPIDDPELAAAADALGGQFPNGYTTELNLAAGPWVESVARCLDRGALFVIDYGFSHDDYYSPLRTEGTLRTFSRHRAGDDPLANPGSQDITAHVDFTSLATHARRSGLTPAGSADQHRYLIRLATPWLRELEAEPQQLAANAAALRQFQTLTHPGLMGRAFNVAAFTKGIPSHPRPFAAMD